MNRTEAAARIPSRSSAEQSGASTPTCFSLSRMVTGYTANREAAAAILEWLEARVEVDLSLGAAIRSLLR